jgi:hypothetical protein
VTAAFATTGLLRMSATPVESLDELVSHHEGPVFDRLHHRNVAAKVCGRETPLLVEYAGGGG